MITLHNVEKFVHAFISSRLDYCNANNTVWCSIRSINKLQLVQNAAERVHLKPTRYLEDNFDFYNKW